MLSGMRHIRCSRCASLLAAGTRRRVRQLLPGLSVSFLRNPRRLPLSTAIGPIIAIVWLRFLLGRQEEHVDGTAHRRRAPKSLHHVAALLCLHLGWATRVRCDSRCFT